MKKLIILSLFLLSGLKYAAANTDTLTFAAPDTGYIPASGDSGFYVVHMNQCGLLLLNLTNIPGLNLEMYAYSAANSDSVIGYSSYGGNRVLEVFAPAGNIYIKVDDHFGNTSANFYIISASLDTIDDCGCNTGFATACNISDSTSFNAEIRGSNLLHSPVYDVDYYKIHMTQCATLVLTLINIPGLNLEMYAYSAPNADSVIGYSSYGGNRILELTPASGDVYVTVGDHFGNLSTTPYNLTVAIDTGGDPYECNNDFSTAYPLPDSITISAQIRGSNLLHNPVIDIDFYKIHMSKCATLVLNLTNIPGLNLEMYAYSAPNTDSLIGYSSYGGNRVLELTPAGGDIYVKVDDHFNNTSASSYTLSVRTDSIDIYECDNDFSTATSIPDQITLNATIRGSNLLHNPVVDRDIYKVQMSKCGTLQLNLTNIPGLNLEMYVFSAPNADSVIGYSSYGGNRSLDITGASGDVYVMVDDHFGNTSANPYTLSVNLDTVDFYECDNSLATATLVPANTTIVAEIDGINAGTVDVDYYRIHMDPCKTLLLALTNIPGMNLEMYAYSAPDPDSIIGYSSYGGNRTLELTPAGGDIYVRVDDHFGNTSRSTYTLSVMVDTVDIYECNNDFSTASPIPDNIILQAEIRGQDLLHSPVPDVDYYKVTVDRCGVLVFDLTNIPGLNLEMTAYDSPNSDSVMAYSSYGGNRSLEVMASPGTYYLLVDDHFGATSSTPYTLNVSFDTSDACECNNVFADACTITDTTTLLAKIRGIDALDNPPVDVDFYSFNVPLCGQLIINLTNIPGLNLEMTVYQATDSTPVVVAYSSYGGNRSLTLNLAPGNYFIEVDDHFGNTSASNYTLSLNFTPNPAVPVVTPPGPFAFCLGDSVILSTSSIIPHFWSTGDTSKSITVTTRGTYADTVRLVNGCTAVSNPVSVQADSMPPVPSITPFGPVSFCNGQDTVLTSSSPVDNFWSTAQNTTFITVTASGAYVDTVKSNPGCFTISDSVLVTVNPNPPVPTITPAGPDTICPLHNDTLNSSASIGNHWSTGDTTVYIVASQAGTYSDTVINQYGCSAYSAPVAVAIAPLPVAGFTESHNNLSYSFTNTSTNATSYLWYFGDGDSSTDLNPAHTYAASGAVTVMLIASNACGEDTSTQSLKVVNGIVEINGPGHMRITPNPCAVCQLTGAAEAADLVVTDILGRVCKTTFTKTAAGYLVELPGASSGVFIIQNRRTEQVVKFVKE